MFKKLPFAIATLICTASFASANIAVDQTGPTLEVEVFDLLKTADTRTKDNRDERQDDRQDCRQAEGAGKDKRDCKQDERNSG